MQVYYRTKVEGGIVRFQKSQLSEQSGWIDLQSIASKDVSTVLEEVYHPYFYVLYYASNG